MKEIQLTKGYVALVDDEDYDWLIQWKWTYKQGYAVRHSEKDHNKNIQMHRLIMGDPENINGLLVDHKDGNKVSVDVRGLNNTRDNLRWATSTQNNTNKRTPKSNTSGYMGVHWNIRDNRYVARVRSKGKNLYQKNFVSLEAAVRAYNENAKKFFGDFARLNQLPE